jgi:nucleotide-binding universal stress UspA family protein
VKIRGELLQEKGETNMIPEIKRILYTTDLSKNAHFAFSYAASLANQYGAKITIFHVLEDLPTGSKGLVTSVIGEDRWQELKKRNEEEVLDTIKMRLQKFCEDMSAQLVDCPFIVDDILVKIGEPVQEILDLAESTNFDIVIMGTHGQGMLADAMMGSTARRVIRRAVKPVLVIRLPEGEI